MPLQFHSLHFIILQGCRMLLMKKIMTDMFLLLVDNTSETTPIFFILGDRNFPQTPSQLR